MELTVILKLVNISWMAALFVWLMLEKRLVKKYKVVVTVTLNMAFFTGFACGKLDSETRSRWSRSHIQISSKAIVKSGKIYYGNYNTIMFIVLKVFVYTYV